MNPKAVILLSGGLDSATVLAIAKNEGFQTFALSFDYSQRHSLELEKAKILAEKFGVADHRIVKLDLFGGSALNDNIPVPKNRNENEIASGIPITYVPARNTIFLANALAYAEVNECDNIFVGVNAIDYSGYPDCRPEYISAFEKLANLATKAGTENNRQLKIHTPLIKDSKAEIIRRGLELGVDYGLTHSCYDPSDEGMSCGECDSCVLRLRGFREAGEKDPIDYV
jgi:7-cyano-7-deazaguanine synthase|tara:strand:+ start:57 stop:737 length:681 start_codon:yes stop_codon:yes gene_type:complete